MNYTINILLFHSLYFMCLQEHLRGEITEIVELHSDLYG